LNLELNAKRIMKARIGIANIRHTLVQVSGGGSGVRLAMRG